MGEPKKMNKFLNADSNMCVRVLLRIEFRLLLGGLV